jgi:hypothetical protein
MRLLSRPLAPGGGGARLKGARSATRCTPQPAARRRRWMGRNLVRVGRKGALARGSSAADLCDIDGVLRGQAAACGAAGHAGAMRGAGTSQLHVVLWLGGPAPAHGTSSDPAVSTERSNSVFAQEDAGDTGSGGCVEAATGGKELQVTVLGVVAWLLAVRKPGRRPRAEGDDVQARRQLWV